MLVSVSELGVVSDLHLGVKFLHLEGESELEYVSTRLFLLMGGVDWCICVVT